MKLLLRKDYSKNEFCCDLTKELDEISGISQKQYYNLYHHYILADEWCRENKCLAIRVPGGTVGGVWVDKNNVITKISVDTDYVIKTYPSDVNELMKRYVGEILEL